ncbi:MAG: sensor histidine kinase, partial [Armatimonadaceae bacterium]
PHIRLIVADQRRRKAVADMTHELSKPVNALRAAVDKLRSDLNRIDKELLGIVDTLGPGTSPSDRQRLREFATSGHRKYFRQDYVKNILSWTRLMVRVIGNADVYGLRSVVPELETEPAYLMAEVVAPAVDMAEHLLKRRGFDKAHIRYDSFADIPRLHVDVNLFQQVFFNLLSNAIKYAYNDPARFGIEISTRVQGDRYCIAVRDWGPGIETSHEKSIFEEGVRGPEHLSDLVGGLGLGLWVVREVVRQHGGQVAVTRNGDPTEISLFLPRSLASAPPRQRQAHHNRDGA